MSHESGELIPVPNKPTTDKVDTPKAAPVKIDPSTPTPVTPVASTSTAVAPNPARNPLAIQLVSFFDTIQRLFEVPTTADLSYDGFEVTFATDDIAWTNAFHDALCAMRTTEEDTERRVFELMPAPTNTALHRYIKDLARVSMDLAALQAAKQEDAAVEQLVMRVRAEQETAQSWMRRVCEAAGALSIADPAFSPRK